jgi:hypothetical protein
MRKTIITAIASAALAVPGIALASHHGERQLRDDHGVQHKRHHARHHRHAHIVTFGAAASSAPSGAPGTSSPTSPVPPGQETAGTVASFSEGTLTIKLNDGSTVSGKVGDFTEIECHPATAAAASHGDDNGQGDDNDQADDNGQGDDRNDGAGHDEGDDNGQDQAEHCTTAALVTGAVVREAELSVSSAGAVWKKVELGQ